MTFVISPIIYDEINTYYLLYYPLFLTVNILFIGQKITRETVKTENKTKRKLAYEM